MPGVDVWRYMGFGVVMRASCGDAICCGVPIALCTPLAPFAMWAYPGDGTRCWSVWGGCGEDLICWLRPEGVRDGIWRLVRLPGDRSSDGDGMVGAACGVGVPAGESDGDNSELISMVYSVHDLLPSFGTHCNPAAVLNATRAPGVCRCSLFLWSRAAETTRHRVPRNERHGTTAGVWREKDRRRREAMGIASVMGDDLVGVVGEKAYTRSRRKGG